MGRHRKAWTIPRLAVKVARHVDARTRDVRKVQRVRRIDTDFQWGWTWLEVQRSLFGVIDNFVQIDINAVSHPLMLKNNVLNNS